MSRAYRIVVLPGDGIGPEVTTEALRVLRTLEAFLPGTSWDLEERPAGADCYRESGIAIPEATWTACREADAIFLGAIGLPDVRLEDGTEVAPQLDLRRDLDLYAGVRPVHLFREEHSPLAGYRAGDIDLVIVRESTEGLFVSRDRGVRVGDEVAVDQLLITRRATERVSRFACELARTRDGKKRVTCVDKSNAFRSYAFFREVFDEVAAEYPHLDTERVYVDAMALYLVQRPGEFDVVVTENLLGDILSDLAASLVGGMGMAPSGDIGERHAVFQPALDLFLHQDFRKHDRGFEQDLVQHPLLDRLLGLVPFAARDIFADLLPQGLEVLEVTEVLGERNIQIGHLAALDLLDVEGVTNRLAGHLGGLVALRVVHR
ncbi:MAG: isocitrate/isopropylmalate family dehydrogenase, partial [Planctomycetota bacterium]|nr:isocitrate/isopropylmalate family dehydrogenase [Planctomycetota bacterium]